jgi:hypothetical protein
MKAKKHGELKLTTLHYNGKWILRTTETGIEINGKVEWYRIVWAYLQYIYYGIKKWVYTNGS